MPGVPGSRLLTIPQLKCSGQKTGCDRCKATSSTCTYGPVDGKERRRRRTNNQKSNNSYTQRPSSRTGTGSAIGNAAKMAPESLEPLPPTSMNEDPVGQTGTSGEDSMQNAVRSPIQSLQEEYAVSDQIMETLMPDFDSGSMEKFLQMPELGYDSTSNLYDRLHYGFFGSNISAFNNTSRECGDSLVRVDMAKAPGCLHIAPPNSPAKAVSPPRNSTPSPDKPSQRQPSLHDTVTAPLPSPAITASPLILFANWDSVQPEKHPWDQCLCLQTVVPLLEELEDRANSVDPQALTSILAWKKEARNHCEAMLRCTCCTARSDYMMLLAVVCDKLVTLCEKVVHRYLSSTGQRLSDQKSGVTSQHKLFVGDYEVDTPGEWMYIMRVLIMLQLGSMGTLLGKMKSIASTALRGTQLTVLRAMDQRVAKMGESLRIS